MWVVIDTEATYVIEIVDKGALVPWIPGFSHGPCKVGENLDLSLAYSIESEDEERYPINELNREPIPYRHLHIDAVWKMRQRQSMRSGR